MSTICRVPGTSRLRRLRGSALGGLTLLLAAALPQAALAGPGDWVYDYDRSVRSPIPLQTLPPLPGRSAYGPGYGGGYPAPRAPLSPDRWAYGYGPGAPPDPALAEAQMAQRCNVGRLVGGIVGGGLGYAASRQDGRTWAVPLGALLGQQMGCSIGAGRSPLPW